MNYFKGRKKVSSRPFVLTCKQVRSILAQKSANPDQEVPNLAEALLHFATCEGCKQSQYESPKGALTS
jgi:hypothetical protein